MYDKILVPTDGGDPVEKAADHAMAIAEKFNAEIYALYVIDTRVADTEDLLQMVVKERKKVGQKAADIIQSKAEERNLEVKADIDYGAPSKTILEYTSENDIDLVVIGTRGRTGLGKVMLGSVAEKVVRLSDAPVMTVRNRKIE